MTLSQDDRTDPKKDPPHVPIFIAYRRADGLAFARLVHDRLKEMKIVEGESPRSIDVFFDFYAAPVANWKDHNFPALSRSESLILIVSPQTGEQREGKNDWLYKEIDWWLRHRRAVAPIVLNTDDQNGDRWIPEPIRTRFPNLRYLPLSLDSASNDNNKVFDRILKGITGELPAWQRSEIERQKSQKKKLAWSLAAAILLGILAVVAGWQFRVQRNVARLQEWQAKVESANTLYEQSFGYVGDGRHQAAAACLLRAVELAPRAGHPEGLDGPSTWAEEAWTHFRFLDALSPKVRTRIKVHTDKEVMAAIAISPDGKTAASGSTDGTLRIWDLEKNKEVHVLRKHWGDVFCAAFTPDGNSVLTGSRDKTLRLWNVKEGSITWEREEHTEWVVSLAISADGSTAVSGSGDGTLRRWDLRSGQCTRVIGHPLRQVWSVAITPDGSKALAASWDQSIRKWDLGLWDLNTAMRLQDLEGHQTRILSLAITGDGKRALSGSDDATLRLWDLETGKTLRVLEGHRDTVWKAVLASDGRKAVTGSGDGTLRIWDLQSGRTLHVLEGHQNQVNCVAMTPNGRTVLSGSGDGSFWIWNVGTEGADMVLSGHEEEILSLALSSDGNRALTGSVDKTLRLWDLELGICLKVLKDNPEPVWNVSITPDGKTGLSAGGGKLQFWDLDRGAKLLSIDGSFGFGTRFAVSPDQRRALTADDRKDLKLWDLQTGSTILQLEGGQRFSDVAFTPDGKGALTASDDTRSGDTKLIYRNLETGKIVCELKGSRNLPENVLFGDQDDDTHSSVVIGPDGKTAFSGSQDGTLRLWDLQSGKNIRVLTGHRGKVSGVAIAPDGTWGASASEDRTVRLWDLRTGKLLRSLEGHQGAVSRVAIAADGKTVVSVSRDKTLRKWRVLLDATPSQPPDAFDELYRTNVLHLIREGPMKGSVGVFRDDPPATRPQPGK